MSHSKTIDVALYELSKAQELYALAVESLKQLQKSKAGRFKELQDSQNNPTQRELYEKAVQQERAAEGDVRLAMDSLRKKQSNYDKLKQRAAAEKKRQKKHEAKKQKRSEQEKERKNNEKKNKNERMNEDVSNEPQGRERFLRDNYQSHPTENREFPRTPATKFLAVPSAWKTACEKALSDRSQMKSFPDPPYKGCGNRSCILSRNQRFLKACRCNIIQSFMQDPEYPECMKTERLRWHPDKFSICPEIWRDIFQGKAREIFVVANFLFERDGREI